MHAGMRVTGGTHARVNSRRTRRYRSPYRLWALAGLLAAAVITMGIALIFDVRLYLAWMTGLSVVLFAFYGLDKRRAASGGGRIPETVLHGFALAGGFAGGWAGRLAFRHKTRHLSFLIVLLLASAAHAGIAFWLLL